MHKGKIQECIVKEYLFWKYLFWNLLAIKLAHLYHNMPVLKDR